MSWIIGKCEHGVIQVALSEELAARSELDDMAACFTLERAETVSFGGHLPYLRGAIQS